jgi:hypothetical protein
MRIFSEGTEVSVLQFPFGPIGASKLVGCNMAIKDNPKRKVNPERERGNEAIEDTTEMMNEVASIDDRIVTNPAPAEQQPKESKRKPIVSVNGEDMAA